VEIIEIKDANVEGKTVVIIDDMIDTAGTMEQSINAIHKKNAKEIYIMATHGIFSKNTIQILQNSPVTQVITTNTIPRKKDQQFEKLKILPIESILGEAIFRAYRNLSISSLFDEEECIPFLPKV